MTLKIPLTIQTHPGENALAAIATMLGYHGYIRPLSELRENNITSRGGSTPEQVREMAARYGLDTEIVRADFEALREMTLPVMVRWKKKCYCVVTRIGKKGVRVADPAKGEYTLSADAFASRYAGTALVMRPGSGFRKGGRQASIASLIRGRLDGENNTLLKLTVLNLLSVGLNLVTVQATKMMLDNADPGSGGTSGELLSLLTSSNLSTYRFLVLLMVGTLILSTVVNIRKTLHIYRTAYSVASRSGTGLFRRMLGQPMQFFEQYRTGELIQRLDSNARLDLSLVRTIVPRLLDIVMTGVYFVLMMSYHWQIAAMCVGIEVIYMIMNLRMRNRIVMQARSNAVSTGNMNTAILNGIGTIETIKAGGAERVFFSEWKKTQDEYADTQRRDTDITATTGMLDSMHALFSQGTLLFAGAYFMIVGNYTFGLMAAMQAVLNSFRNVFSNCVQMVNRLQKTRTDIERIEDIRRRDIREEIPLPEDEDPDKLKGRLEVSGLTYRYQEGEAPAIDGISFTAEPGQMIAIVGPSGCGKSTLLKCLLSLYTPESGEVRYDGLTRGEIPDAVFHATVAAVDQESMLFDDSIADNLKMWDSTIQDFEMILAARDAQIHGRIMQEPDGYYSMMPENGRNFSGGELQRMELARALSMEPTLLLLDEFTSALDAVTEEHVFESLRQKRVTCVIVAHRLSTITCCDRILVMDGGKIVQSGTHEELYRTEGLYRKLLQMPGEA